MDQMGKGIHEPPAFWRVLDRPSQDSAPLPLQSADSLSNHQSSTLAKLIGRISTTDYCLPSTLKELTDYHSKTKANPASSQPRPSSWTSLDDQEKCYCSSECLMRICRAIKWDFNRALHRLEETLVWRREFQINKIDLQMISKEAETGKQFVLGYDVRSRPCLYMFPYKQNTEPSQNQIKFVVWCLERTIDLMPLGVETLTLLIDFGSSSNHHSSGGQPTTISQAKEVLKILQTYYCERLGRAICINVPWVFWGFYKIIKPFMDPRTAEKIQFDPPMTELVHPEQLQRSCFGGELEFEYDHQTYFPLLIKMAESRRKSMLERYKRFGRGRCGISELELKGGGLQEGGGVHSDTKPIDLPVNISKNLPQRQTSVSSIPQGSASEALPSIKSVTASTSSTQSSQASIHPQPPGRPPGEEALHSTDPFQSSGLDRPMSPPSETTLTTREPKNVKSTSKNRQKASPVAKILQKLHLVHHQHPRAHDSPTLPTSRLTSNSDQGEAERDTWTSAQSENDHPQSFTSSEGSPSRRPVLSVDTTRKGRDGPLQSIELSASRNLKGFSTP